VSQTTGEIMNTVFARSLALVVSTVLVLGLSAGAARSQQQKKDEDQEKKKDRGEITLPIDVYEWSVWVGNPAAPSFNTQALYRNPMPNTIGTSRPKVEDKDLARKFPIAPVSIVQFFGEPRRDVDVDARVKKGLFLSHWPPSKEHTGRLQWFGSELMSTPPANIPQAYLPGTHWFERLRQTGSTLYLKYENNFERFIAYDADVQVPTPVKIRGGPAEYTLQNLTSRRLLDVAVIAPAEKGFRVGWLDELPTAVPPEKEEPAPKKTNDPKVQAARQKEKADAIFNEAEKTAKKDEIPPLPKEGDANVRARLDQLLNQPVNVAVEGAPRREVLNLICGQARLRYEIDEPTLAKEQINLGEPTTMRASGIAARDALADLLGNLGLSYRITEEGRLFITTAARLAADNDKKGAVMEGPPVKLVMSQPREGSDASYRESTRDAYARRLAGQGLREDLVHLVLEQYGKALFEPGELLVLVHLTRDAIDEAVLLDVFPQPRKLVRTALLVVHGVDPRLQDRARTLVKQLGDPSAQARETAETRLFELGPVAVPALEDALLEKDIEIVFRAERLLLRLNRPLP
jgi:hypothetical protein